MDIYIAALYMGVKSEAASIFQFNFHFINPFFFSFLN